MSGNRRARRRLVDRVNPLIEARVHQSVSREKRIGINGYDDITQQVWVRLFDRDAHRLHGFDPERGSLEGYISTIAQSVILDLIKARNGRINVAVLHEEQIEDSAPSAEERTALKQLAQRLRLHLDSVLPTRGKLVLKLLYDDGREVDEAAEIMGVSNQVVANWKHKIKTLAREFREKYG